MCTMDKFEQWFKTTESYDFLKQMNYFNIDLFTFNKDRNQYQHSAVQIAYMTWQEQQKRIDELEQSIHNIYMNAESNCCDSCKYAESEAMSVGCGF